MDEMNKETTIIAFKFEYYFGIYAKIQKKQVRAFKKE